MEKHGANQNLDEKLILFQLCLKQDCW